MTIELQEASSIFVSSQTSTDTQLHTRQEAEAATHTEMQAMMMREDERGAELLFGNATAAAVEAGGGLSFLRHHEAPSQEIWDTYVDAVNDESTSFYAASMVGRKNNSLDRFLTANAILSTPEDGFQSTQNSQKPFMLHQEEEVFNSHAMNGADVFHHEDFTFMPTPTPMPSRKSSLVVNHVNGAYNSSILPVSPVSLPGIPIFNNAASSEGPQMISGGAPSNGFGRRWSQPFNYHPAFSSSPQTSMDDSHFIPPKALFDSTPVAAKTSPLKQRPVQQQHMDTLYVPEFSNWQQPLPSFDMSQSNHFHHRRMSSPDWTPLNGNFDNFINPNDSQSMNIGYHYDDSKSNNYDFVLENFSSSASSSPSIAKRRHSTTNVHSPMQCSSPNAYRCPFESCGKMFSRFYNLRSHYRIHSGEKPFVCDVCDASFARNHDLKRHQRIHSGTKPFKCELCNKTFSRNDAMTRHVKLNSCVRMPQGSNMEGLYNAEIAAEISTNISSSTLSTISEDGI